MGAVERRGSLTFLHWIQSVSCFFFFFFPKKNYDINLLLFHHRYSSDHEKIIAAAADFTSGRVWPVNFASESGPKFVWEKVRQLVFFLDRTYD